jgi:hypothetical protein
MRQWIWILATATCLSAASVTVDAASAQADDYWDGYWSWYDGTYRPYVTRRYYYSAPHTTYYGPYYGPSYGYYPGDGYYYGRRYYGDYYGTPNFGYRDFPGGGGQVRVGPLRFGWR